MTDSLRSVSVSDVPTQPVFHWHSESGSGPPAGPARQRAGPERPGPDYRHGGGLSAPRALRLGRKGR
jgi:hypothetical protein